MTLERSRAEQVLETEAEQEPVQTTVVIPVEVVMAVELATAEVVELRDKP